MKIKVTQKHIDKAREIYQKQDGRLISGHCPIALAVKEHIHRWVSVSPDKVKYLSSSGNLQSFSLPENARKFVDQFDDHLMHNYKACPKPFTFSI
jgi:hypothetical protein